MERIPAKLDQLHIVVPDMSAAVDFYGRLGIEIPDTMPEWQAHHRTAETPGDFDIDFDSMAFAAHWNGGWSPSRTGVILDFRVAGREEVDLLYAELTGAGYAGQQEPYDAFWGARYALVEDPGGNAVGLMSPVDRARRTPPPAPPGSSE